MENFYQSAEWNRLRIKILETDRHECQACRSKGQYSRATHVHHVNYVNARPDLRLSETYTDTSGCIRRNLISLCRECHERIHQSLMHEKVNSYTNEEKW